MNRILSILLMISVAMAFPLLPSVGWTQEAPQKFEDLDAEQKKKLGRLIGEAKSAYNNGEFEASLSGFREAFDIFPHPDFLYRMALCFERLGEDLEAVRYYRRFLAAVPDAPERLRIEKTIETIEARVSKSELEIVTLPEGAVVYVDDVANGPSGYTPTQLPVRPGNYRVIVQKEGYESIEELVAVESGESVKLRYQLVKIPSVVGGNEAVSESGNSNSGKVVALTSVGVGSAIASIIFFSLYSDAKITVDGLREQESQEVSRQRLEDAETKMYTYLGLGVSTAAISAGALLWAYLSWNSGVQRSSMKGSDAGPMVWWDSGPAVGWRGSW